MRYQQFSDRTAVQGRAVAAVWPTLEEALRGQADEQAPAMPATAAPDVPAAVGGLIVASYLTLLGVLFAFFAGSPLAFLCLSICAVFVAVFFAVPRIFFAVEARPGARPALSRFMHEGMQTLTGRSGGKDALVQMLIVPVLLTMGLMAMGIIGKIFIG